MDLFDRIYKLDGIFKSSRYPVSRARLQERLECSRATVHRILRYLKDYLAAPVIYDSEAQGYQYDPTQKTYELPGLWFNASELHALLTAQQLLSKVQPGLFEDQLKPLQARIEKILKSRRLPHADLSRRIRLLGMANRSSDPQQFQAVASALLQRRQLSITYHSRSQNKTTARKLSPQRLIYYRDNWYLDAWDHGKRALRSFAVERIKQARTGKEKSKAIPDVVLDEHFGTAYGIFAGQPGQTAVLKFSAERSRWVAEEVWHPRQKQRLEDGCYILEVPYSDSRELVMDILKHMPEVTVLGPAELQAEVVERLEQALKLACRPGKK